MDSWLYSEMVYLTEGCCPSHY